METNQVWDGKRWVYLKMKSNPQSGVLPTFVTCLATLTHVISPSIPVPFPATFPGGSGVCRSATLSPSSPTCCFAPWILAHHISLLGSDTRSVVMSHTSISRSFPPTYVPQNLLFWHQPLRRHTLNTSLVNGKPQTPADCGRLGGCGGLSKETIRRKHSVLGANLEPQGFRGSTSHTCREGRENVEGKNCLISPSSGSWTHRSCLDYLSK